MTIRSGYAPGPDDEKPKMVRAGDGRVIILTEANGPVNLDGTHANLDDVAPPTEAPQPAEEPAKVEPKRQPRTPAK